MAIVPEGQADSSQARSAWVAMQRGAVPEGRSKSLSVLVSPRDICRHASGRDTVLFGNSAQERPEPFPQLRVQHRDTLFGAENTMNIERAKGVGHGRIIFWHFIQEHIFFTFFR